jgi:aspartyl aminopeptidase
MKTVPFRSQNVLLRIPQLAIHLNRGVNDDGLKLNKQTHMPPILAMSSDPETPLDDLLLRQLLADDLGLKEEQVINWQLECFDTQPAALSGLHSEFIVSGRLDNLTMCHAALQALTGCDSRLPQTAMIALFDNEEIGSATMNGAASSFMRDIIQRVIGSDGAAQGLQRGLARSMCVSADGAHAIHPNLSCRNGRPKLE